MDKGFNLLHNILKATGARQKVISSNLANSDTPGYKAKDVKFSNLIEKQRKILKTDPKHMGGADGGNLNSLIKVEQTPSWGDKNNVELNVEVAKMTENSLLHEAAVTILSKKIKMYKNAIGGQ